MVLTWPVIILANFDKTLLSTQKIKFFFKESSQMGRSELLYNVSINRHGRLTDTILVQQTLLTGFLETENGEVGEK